MEAIRTFINGIYWTNNCACNNEESKNEKTIDQDILCGITHWFALLVIIVLIIFVISSSLSIFI